MFNFKKLKKAKKLPPVEKLVGSANTNLIASDTMKVTNGEYKSSLMGISKSPALNQAIADPTSATSNVAEFCWHTDWAVKSQNTTIGTVIHTSLILVLSTVGMIWLHHKKINTTMTRITIVEDARYNNAIHDSTSLSEFITAIAAPLVPAHLEVIHAVTTLKRMNNDTEAGQCLAMFKTLVMAIGSAITGELNETTTATEEK